MHNHYMKLKPIVISLIVAILIGLAYYCFFTPTFGSTSFVQRRNFKEIGTSAAPLTLTNAFADADSVSSTSVDAKGMNTVVVAGTWLPKSAGSRLYLKFQQSPDGTNFFDRSLETNIPNYGTAGTGGSTVASSTLVVVGATSTSGIPYVIGDWTTTSGTALSFSFPVKEFVGGMDAIKVFAQEMTSTTHGTLHMQVNLNN